MREGWELVHQSGRNHTWNSVSRDYGQYAYQNYQQWLVMNHRNNSGEYALRKVTEQDPPLSAEPLETEETDMADRNTQAKNDAIVFASRLAEMLRNPGSVDTAVLFGVARKFAKFEGYTDADGAFAYIEGFVQGFGGNGGRSLSAPSTANTVDASD